MKQILFFIAVIFSTSELIAQNYKFGKVSKEELEEKFYPLDSTAEAAYLYNYRRTFYSYNKNDGFRIINEHHVRIKIYNKDGFKYATKTLRYYKPDKGDGDRISSISAVTYNLENGKIKQDKIKSKDIFDEKLSKYYSLKKMTLPNIKEGSVIEFKYKLTSPYNLSVDDLNFQYAIPVKKMYASVEIPEYYNFNRKNTGYYMITPKQSVKNRSISFTTNNRVGDGWVTSNEVRQTRQSYRGMQDLFEAENIPALKDNEPFVNNIANYRGGVKYELSFIKYPNSSPKYYNTTWDKVTKQIYATPTFGGELKKSSYYKDDLATLLASSNTEIEKIANIYQFVKSKVKWNGYYGKYTDTGVRKAYKEGVGNSADINLMLTSMLRTAGIQAHPVLVSSRNNGIPLFPTSRGFNYVVSVAFIGENYVLLDATEPYSLPNMLPTRALNWNGRIVRQNGSSSWIPLASSKPALINHIVNAKINLDEGIVEGLIRSKYDNLSALNFRRSNNQIKEEELQNKLEEDYNIEIENFRISNKLKLGKPVSRMIKFSSEDLLEEINGKIYIDPLLFYTSKVNPFKSEERKFPVEFDSPWKNSYIVSMVIPEGYTLESVPEPLAIGMSKKIGVFKFQVKQLGNKISVMSSIEFNESSINPNYYQELREFYKKIVEIQSKKIVLVKKS